MISSSAENGGEIRMKYYTQSYSRLNDALLSPPENFPWVTN